MSENFNIDSLLDGTLDDLADMPEFKPYPAGTHTVNIKWEQKKVGTHPAIEFKFSAIETNELANSEDVPLAKGDETSIACMLDNDYGQGLFKLILTAAAAQFGQKPNRELLADIQGATAIIVTKIRQNKEKTQSFTNLVEIAFA